MCVSKQGGALSVATVFLPMCLALSGGCIIAPRSAVFGQTAVSGLGRWAAEASVSPGVSYSQTVSPPETTADGSEETITGSTVFVGALEGNAILGFSDRLGLNVHLSQAGIQPGLKVAVLRRWVSLAVLPEMGIGHFEYGEDSTLKKSGVSKTKTTYDYEYTVVTVGFKTVLSMAFGLYVGLGYDLGADPRSRRQ